MKWAAHVARMGEMRNAYKILVGNAGGKGPLGRLRIVTSGGVLWTW